MQTETTPSPMTPPPTPQVDRRFPIRFPGRRDRKLKCWQPDLPKMPGARSCAAGMVRIAIDRRQVAERHTRQARELLSLGGAWNEAKARGERLRARLAREDMRTSALWARVFAHHLENDDPRLEELARQQGERIRRSCRAHLWHGRWERVRSIEERGWNQPATLARTGPLLRRIAEAHDCLEPYGYTLLQYCEA